MQYSKAMKTERTGVDIVGVALFLALATVLSALWGYFASSHGMLSDPRTAGLAAWLAQTTVFIAAHPVNPALLICN
jgi:TRAP-type mannitol/chloroaromatic compound transport system permease small subunit